jgi:hypothetical protein
MLNIFRDTGEKPGSDKGEQEKRRDAGFQDILNAQRVMSK